MTDRKLPPLPYAEIDGLAPGSPADNTIQQWARAAIDAAIAAHRKQGAELDSFPALPDLDGDEMHGPAALDGLAAPEKKRYAVACLLSGSDGQRNVFSGSLRVYTASSATQAQDMAAKGANKSEPQLSVYDVLCIEIDDPQPQQAPEEFLRSVINLCGHHGASPFDIEGFDPEDKWIADLWRKAQAMLEARAHERQT